MTIMRPPRWTVYPALAVIATLVVTAIPHTGGSSLHRGSAKRARAAFEERAILAGEGQPNRNEEAPPQVDRPK